MQFSPTTQSVKNAAIDRIVEQSIWIPRTDAISVDEIVDRSAVVTNGGTEIPVLRHSDVVDSINRLIAAGRVRATDRPNAYTLSDSARAELERTRGESITRARRIVNRLFRARMSDPERLIDPFFELLSRIFSRLGASYVGALTGDAPKAFPVSDDDLRAAASSVASRHGLSETLLHDAAVQFFEATDPDAVATKWNLTQSFYVALALGLDPSGALLGDDLLGNCSLYLDTNMVIQGLEAMARLHGSFQTLVRVSNRMGIALKVWSGTLRELNRVVDFHVGAIEKIRDRIPEGSEVKIQGIFYEKYRRESQGRTDDVEIGSLFENFSEGRRTLVTKYRIEVEDDSADEEEERERVLEEDIVPIIELYGQRRSRHKSRVSAIHDATLIYKAVSNATGNSKCLVVTLDMVLPEIRLKGHEDVSAALTLDALLQWISPFANVMQDDDEFATIFANALASQVLPAENLFDVRDFLIFQEIDWDTKRLPAEDVENCIFHLRKVAPGLDPSRAEDREKLHGEVARYFADPGRKYHEQLKNIEESVELIRREAERDRKEASEREGALRGELDRSSGRVDELKEQIREGERERKEEALGRSTRIRVILLVVLEVVLVGGVVGGAFLWGSGDNGWQKIVGSWGLVLGAAGIPPVLAYPVLGRRRLGRLGVVLKGVLGIGSGGSGSGE